MMQLYVTPIDGESARHSFLAKTSLTITGLTTEGKIETVTGRPHAILAGQTAFDGYPIRVTIILSTGNGPLAAANSNQL
jgi:hypothetical protein